MPIKPDSHPDRTDLLKAIESGRVPFSAHLKKCPQCRALFELLSSFQGSAGTALDSPSEKLIARHAAIPFLVDSRAAGRTTAGILAYDSWRSLPAAQLREAAQGMERRLRFTCGEIALEVVAERQPEGWEFSARVYREASFTDEFVLKVGRLRLLPEAYDCYYWTGSRLPRSLELLSSALRVTFPFPRPGSAVIE